MIYLITGKPGTGKTLHMVSMLAKREDLRNRPLYIDGINELDSDKIPYLPMPEGCNGGNWHEWLPEGAILVIDECQRYWRQRSSASKVPEAVQAMETHRHKGIDIYLLCQSPKQIDHNIKELVRNHKHLWVSQLGTRRMYEWQKCGNPDSSADVGIALVRSYKLDESVYNLYKCCWPLAACPTGAMPSLRADLNPNRLRQRKRTQRRQAAGEGLPHRTRRQAATAPQPTRRPLKRSRRLNPKILSPAWTANRGQPQHTHRRTQPSAPCPTLSPV